MNVEKLVYKVGDFVRETKKPDNVKCLAEDDLNAFNNVEGYIPLGDIWEPWVPKKGDLVVYNFTGRGFCVGTYSYEEKNGHVIEGSTYCFRNIGPYLGYIPEGFGK